jgi:hypothetical protein
VGIKKKLFWVTNFSVLAFFSFYTLSGFLGFGTSQAYAATLKEGDFHKKGKHFVVVENDEGQPQGSLSSEQEICTLSSTQAAELDAFFNVKIMDIQVSGETTVELAAVHGKHLTKRQLLEFLRASDESLDCHVVSVRHIFFLPVIPQIS